MSGVVSYVPKTRFSCPAAPQSPHGRYPMLGSDYILKKTYKNRQRQQKTFQKPHECFFIQCHVPETFPATGVVSCLLKRVFSCVNASQSLHGAFSNVTRFCQAKPAERFTTVSERPKRVLYVTKNTGDMKSSLETLYPR